jgi:hypothetical protein
MAGIGLLRAARRASLRLAADDRDLVVRGPRSALGIAESLIRHKPEVLSLLRTGWAELIVAADPGPATRHALSRWPHDLPPLKPCKPFGTGDHTIYWRRPQGGWVCAACHPPPPGLVVDAWDLATVDGSDEDE